MKRGGPLKRTTALKRTGGPRRRRAIAGPFTGMDPAAVNAARRAFRAAVLPAGAECIRAKWADHRCDGELDPHHVLRAATLRAHTSTLPDDEALAIIFDPRDGVPVCRGLHANLTVAYTRLHKAELPEHVLEFAAEHRLLHALEREVSS